MIKAMNTVSTHGLPRISTHREVTPKRLHCFYSRILGLAVLDLDQGWQGNAGFIGNHFQLRLIRTREQLQYGFEHHGSVLSDSVRRVKRFVTAAGNSLVG